MMLICLICPKHMEEYIHLIDGLIGYVYTYDPLQHVQMLNMSNGATCIVLKV